MNFKRLNLIEFKEKDEEENRSPEEKRVLKKRKEREKLAASQLRGGPRTEYERVSKEIGKRVALKRQLLKPKPLTPVKKPADIQAKVKEHFEKIMRTKEIKHLLEAHLSDWKSELAEEHPYVEVMPVGVPTKKDKIKNKMKEIGNEALVKEEKELSDSEKKVRAEKKRIILATKRKEGEKIKQDIKTASVESEKKSAEAHKAVKNAEDTKKKTGEDSPESEEKRKVVKKVAGEARKEIGRLNAHTYFGKKKDDTIEGPAGPVDHPEKWYKIAKTNPEKVIAATYKQGDDKDDNKKKSSLLINKEKLTK